MAEEGRRRPGNTEVEPALPLAAARTVTRPPAQGSPVQVAQVAAPVPDSTGGKPFVAADNDEQRPADPRATWVEEGRKDTHGAVAEDSKPSHVASAAISCSAVAGADDGPS